MNSTAIPTPAEFIDAARSDHDAEADALIARIVAKLRANPHGRATEEASMFVIDIVKKRMTERGWTCEVWRGDVRDPMPSISVWAPTPQGGAR